MALIMPSCNKGEGMGGTGTVQGFVKLVHHPDDDYTLTPDTVNAAKTDVFIVYGDENFFGDDIETGADGGYRFEYLRPGNYWQLHRVCLFHLAFGPEGGCERNG